MDRNNLALEKKNYLILIAGMVVVVIGFILMAGPGSTPDHFNPDIFSARRIRVAPAVCLLGFVAIGYGLIGPVRNQKETTKPKEGEQ